MILLEDTRQIDRKLYSVWNNMRGKCYRPKDRKYKNFGEKGIKICDEWKDSFINFKEWAVNNGYRDFDCVRLVRLNNDLDFSPQNCKWEKINKHNGSGKKLYGVWNDMRQRCSNQAHQAWEHYGGRGIKVCDEWDKDYVEFEKWAIESGYKENKGLSIDRIDVNGNYEPSNCRWADIFTQNANKTSHGNCSEYLGVYKCNKANVYRATIMDKGKTIFYYDSKSKNDCAKKRNEFIISNNLSNPLNEIKEEYEDLLCGKKRYLYTAKSKKDKTVLQAKRAKDLAECIGVSSAHILSVVYGRYNDKNYVISREVIV